MKKLIFICSCCGNGKSTNIEYLKSNSKYQNQYAFLDIDELGLNWHDYNGTEKEKEYIPNCLKRSVHFAGDKDVVLACCLNPLEYNNLEPLKDITKTYFINLVCSDNEISKRLKGRDKSRMTHSDEFIKSQIEYMNWFRNNSHRMNLVIDNSTLSVNDTSKRIDEYLYSLMK